MVPMFTNGINNSGTVFGYYGVFLDGIQFGFDLAPTPRGVVWAAIDGFTPIG